MTNDKNDMPDEKPDDAMAYFGTNVDSWGCKEWLKQLITSVKNQDKYCVKKDEISFKTWSNISISNMLRLVRDYGSELEAALALQAKIDSGECVVKWYKLEDEEPPTTKNILVSDGEHVGRVRYNGFAFSVCSSNTPVPRSDVIYWANEPSAPQVEAQEGE